MQLSASLLATTLALLTSGVIGADVNVCSIIFLPTLHRLSDLEWGYKS
jgi:hypothetical protein